VQLVAHSASYFVASAYQPYVHGVEVSLLGEWAVPMKKIWCTKNPAEGATGATQDAQPRQ